MKTLHRLFYIAALALIVPPTLVHGQVTIPPKIKLAWNPNPEPDIAGYKILVGEQPGVLTTVIPVAKVTSHVIENLKPLTRYYFSLKAVNTAGLESDPAAEISAVTKPATSLPAPMDRTGWQIASVSSQETIKEDNKASNAIDGNSDTIWHTVWTNTPPPHFITIMLPKPATVGVLYYSPRQDGETNGVIKSYRIETSMLGEVWTQVADGTWPGGPADQYASFDPVQARYIRLWSLDTFAAASEIHIGGTYLAVIRVTLQRSGDLLNWADIETFEFPKQEKDFFRLKLEP